MAACAVAVAFVFSACGLFREEEVVPTPIPEPPNLLVNGGFEGAPAPWTGVPQPQLGSHAHAGGSSLQVARGTAASQQVVTAQFPEFISGFYRVDDWPDEGGGFLEAVVTMQQGDPALNKSVRLVIGGIDRQPEGVTDTFVFLSRDDPVVGDWTYFAYPLPDAFIRFAGGYPETWAGIDITLSYTGASSSDVAWYDDLYLGTQAGNPNRPAEALDD